MTVQLTVDYDPSSKLWVYCTSTWVASFFGGLTWLGLAWLSLALALALAFLFGCCSIFVGLPIKKKKKKKTTETTDDQKQNQQKQKSSICLSDEFDELWSD